MSPTTILQNLKNEALESAALKQQRHLHYNGHKSIQGRQGYANHNGLQCIFTFYASGRTRTEYRVGFAKLSYNEAVQYLKTGSLSPA